jgi:lipopolysaccharide transport system permease protein
MRLILTAWMFLTPIVYPLEMIPERFRGLMFLNPMAVIVTSYRQVMLDGHSPEWGHLLWVILFGGGLAILGYLWFMKTKKAFADLV